MVPSFSFRGREELIDVHWGHRSGDHKRGMAVFRLEPTKILARALKLLDESFSIDLVFE